MGFESDIESLRRCLAEAEENLRLIHVRKSQYVLQTDIPLQLIKEEQRLEEEIKDLQVQLARVQPQPLALSEHRGGCRTQIDSRIVDLRVWYRKLPTVPQVAIVVALIGLLGALCTAVGTLSVPIVEELARRFLARPTEVPMLTPAPTTTATPTLTYTPLLAPTHTPTLPLPTATPTPTPDCRDVQVSYLKLNLATGTNQIKELNGNREIALTRAEIGDLAILSGRAVLSGANAADCTCYWEGRTNGIDWQPLRSIDCGFSIQIPDQVDAIDLKLMLGGKTFPFALRVR